MLPEGLHVVESQGERLGILPEKCPPSSAELAEIISEPRRDHKSTSPRSEVHLAEIRSAPRSGGAPVR